MNDSGRSKLAVMIAVVVLESFLYGVFLVCFFANLCLRISAYAKPTQVTSHTQPWRNPVAISTMAIFLTCTAHWILTAVRFFRAVIGSEDIQTELRYFGDDSQITEVARSALLETTILIGDAVIIDRLWLIWNRNLGVVVVPAALWLGAVACGIVVTYLCSQSHFGHNLFVISAGWIVTANWLLTMMRNHPRCVAFIVWKVWRTIGAVKDIGDGLLMPVLAIMVESAAIWTGWVIFFAVAYQTRSVLRFLAKDLIPPVVALTNMFIHLRVGLGWSRTAQETDRSGVQMTSNASMVCVPTIQDRFAQPESYRLGTPVDGK
ncbi:hypothetical protein B0H13DRAFT_1630678 [Mycena leptocephala]|nr:hypothetical protein B0H13DRAFT_1630678 [Mycena leptocephala]